MPFLSTVSTIPALRSALLPWREAGETVALVPTMGALHAGHMALIAAAKAMAKRVVATIFVNPTQFGPSEDLSAYPRPLEADQKLLTDAGCDLLYTPGMDVMYPSGFASAIDPGPLGQMLEGQFRPGHFNGVATVVTKLLMQAMPDVALFGEKDFQQLQVIRRVVRDLDLPVYIHGVPTVRDQDKLALSSRNVYLSVIERKTAALLPQLLAETVEALQIGASVEAVLQKGRDRLTVARICGRLSNAGR